MEAGYILIERETDECYGRVQWRNELGEMTDNIKVVEQSWARKGYVFCEAGLGALILVA